MNKVLQVILGWLAGLLPGISEARRKRRAEIRTALVQVHEHVNRIAHGDWAGQGEGDEVRLAWQQKVWPVCELGLKVRQVMDVDRRTAGLRWCNHVEDCLTKGWNLVLHPFKTSTIPNLDYHQRHEEFGQLRTEYMALYKKITQ